jgi:hypothetical protein
MFAADGANVMMERQSVSTLLKNDVPELLVFKCIFHSFVLCTSYACKKLPDSIENLVRKMFKFFQYSAKKASELKEFQQFCDLKPQKILNPWQTRWLSLQAVVKPILEQWDALKLFFINEAAEIIFNKMHDVFSKLYLQFLDFILPYMTDHNKEMQLKTPKIHILYSRVECVYKTIREMFTKKEYLQKTLPLSNIDYKNPHNIRLVEDISSTWKKTVISKKL